MAGDGEGKDSSHEDIEDLCVGRADESLEVDSVDSANGRGGAVKGDGSSVEYLELDVESGVMVVSRAALVK